MTRDRPPPRRPPSLPPVARRPPALNKGVPTTTAVAFLFAGELHLERMNAIAFDGAGILAPIKPEIGAVFPVVFRLSTAEQAIRCTVKVLRHIPTTPAAVHAGASERGDTLLGAIATSGGVSDSATAIFRMSDVDRMALIKKSKPGVWERATPVTAPEGFCVQFVELSSVSGNARTIIEDHIRTSTALADRLAAQQGQLMALDRSGVADMFDAGDLSQRALEW